MNEPCPYCGSEVVLQDSAVIYHGKSFGLVWICSNYPACDAYVGVHTGTTRPLGRLANAELREWKKRAHSYLDPFWKSKRYTRKKAYSIASDLLGKPVSKTHIGMFDVQECKDLIASLKQLSLQLP
jgi:hypothetical protein